MVNRLSPFEESSFLFKFCMPDLFDLVDLPMCNYENHSDTVLVYSLVTYSCILGEHD